MLYPINRSIPTNTDAALVAWSFTFSAGITANPATYNTDAPTALAVADAQGAFSDAYDIAGVADRVAVNPAGYTKPLRAALYAARAAMLDLVRPLASQIQQDNSISDENKLLIGVQPKNLDRVKVYAPDSAPTLAFLQAGVGTHLLTFADSLTPSKKLIPVGAIGIHLYLGVGITQTPLATCKFYRLFARWPAKVSFDSADSGKLATYYARWSGRRGDVGPWSAALTATVLFSAV